MNVNDIDKNSLFVYKNFTFKLHLNKGNPDVSYKKRRDFSFYDIFI